MNVHEVKISPRYFDPVISGVKTFEIRRNDRDYRVGDMVHLKEWDGNSGESGRSALVEVVYVTDHEQHEGFVVFGFKIVKVSL